jgi:putative aldouronate transport system permease protein
MRVTGNMGMSSAVGLLQSVVGFVLVMVTNYASKKIDPESGLF